MKKVSWIALVCLVWTSPHTLATTYFLKFTTSGSTMTAGNLQADNAAWVDVSIVTSVGSDGHVHWPNSQVGSNVSYYIGPGQSVSGGNKNSFYLADVPRSITIVENDGTTPTEIKAGAGAIRFPLGPAFLLPDGFLVAPAINRINTSTKYIRIVAAPGYRATPNNNGNSCSQGWGYENGNAYVVQQRSYEIRHWSSQLQEYYYMNECKTATVFSGPLSHVVRFK